MAAKNHVMEMYDFRLYLTEDFSNFNGSCATQSLNGKHYIGKHQKTDQLLVLKILPIVYSEECPGIHRDKDVLREKFIADVDLIAKLKASNKSLAKVYGCIADNNNYAIVREHFKYNIFDGLRNSRETITHPMMLAFVSNIMYDIADSLNQMITTYKLAHGALKPDNLFMDANLHAKITDFGLVKFLSSYSSNLSRPERVIKDEIYIAPELRNSVALAASESSDVYSYGIIFFEIIITSCKGRCIGFEDFRKRNSKILEADFEGTNCPPLLRNLIFQCTQDDRNSRPSMEDITKTLKELRNTYGIKQGDYLQELKAVLLDNKTSNGIHINRERTDGAASQVEGASCSQDNSKSSTSTDCFLKVYIKIHYSNNAKQCKTKNWKSFQSSKRLDLINHNKLNKWLAKRFKTSTVGWCNQTGELILRPREKKETKLLADAIKKKEFDNYLMQNLGVNAVFETTIQDKDINAFCEQLDQDKEEEIIEEDGAPCDSDETVNALLNTSVQQSTKTVHEAEQNQVQDNNQNRSSSSTSPTRAAVPSVNNVSESSLDVDGAAPAVVYDANDFSQAQYDNILEVIVTEKSNYYALYHRLKPHLSEIKKHPKSCPVVHACVVKGRMDLIRAVYWHGLWNLLAYVSVPHNCWSILTPYRGKTPREIATILQNDTEKDLVKYQHFDSVKHPLKTALQKGATAAVKNILLSIPEAIKEKFSDGMDALQWAVIMGSLEIVKHIVQNGESIHDKLESGENMLHVACALGHRHMVKYLIEDCKVDQNQRGPNGRSPIDYAAECGNIDLFDTLLQLDSHIEYSALIVSSMKGQADFVKMMNRRCKLDLGFRDRYDRTCLHHAVENNHIDVALVLIDSGSEVTAVDRNKRNLYHMAAERGFDKLIRRLHNRIERIELLNARDKYIGSDHCFLVRGSDHGKPAYHYVEVKRRFIKIFLERTKGGNLDVARFGDVVLSGWGSEPTTQDISSVEQIYNGRFTAAESKLDMTPLHLSIMKEKWSTTCLLAEVGADLNAKDMDGNTPLHLACMKGNNEVVKFLVEKGADVQLVDKDQVLPERVAIDNGHFQIVEFLKGIRGHKMTKDLVVPHFQTLQALLNENIPADELRDRLLLTLRNLDSATGTTLECLGSGVVALESNQQ